MKRGHERGGVWAATSDSDREQQLADGCWAARIAGTRMGSDVPGLAGPLKLSEEPLMSKDSIVLLDAAGRRRSPATTPGYLAGRAPRNKGMQYPPDPPRPEEIILVMRQAGHDRHGLRIRALIAVLWRGGLRISEALALNETDVDARRGSLLIRHGKRQAARGRDGPVRF